ncbi:unnamed protein product [Miscanthus lutarioriparius]|uniref:Leucine-rich repeat-containing N-terminal plant-type domain-containing protein n=1 Tax=Miscanthus lutarioriparius TaxID=422564 RepID=A0A811QAT7_9POAL|nr:unnamed protein product [Miscanthus lutarioriparius]
MGSSIGVVVVAEAKAVVVDPLPCILGDDSSESEGDAMGASSATTSRSEEASARADHARHQFKTVDYHKLLCYNLEHNCFGHHMSEVLEERVALEVIKRGDALEFFQKELDRVEDEKKQLAVEASDLRIALWKAEDVKTRVESLEKEVHSLKATKELSLSWLEKAVASNEGLRKEIEAERSSSQALGAQVELLQKRLEDARAASVAVAELFFGWFKENLAKLPDFIGGAMDFGALSCTTNLCKTLGRMGCSHFVGLKGRKDLDGPSELGETSTETMKPVQNFMKYFWVKFGRADACSMAEAHHAAISMLTLITNILFVTSTSPSPNPSHHDFLALLSLKSHITSDALSSWDAASNDTSKPVPNFCKWTGVTCGDRRHPGHVTAIDLHGYGLGGTISQDIGNLTYLHFIDLSSNNLVGDIPSSLGNCRRLRTMNLSSNHLSGSVPTPLGHLSKLKIFNVNYNNLTGEIPTTLFNVTTLMFLRIGGNSFQGQIPSWLSNLTSLTDLYLVNNNFSGNIPADLCKLSNLTGFDVMNNKLDGPVPPSLFNISSITILGLAKNQLTGSLPLDIGFKLPKLYALVTYNNYFEGPIPASLSNASELQYLILRGNQYHGFIPREIGIHGKLKFFSVGHNELQTTKPTDWEFITSITNCSNLKRIDLEQNNFSGVMPVSIANLSRKLEWLTIGTNHIAGTISWVGMFQNLTKLTLEDNLFTGTLPI